MGLPIRLRNVHYYRIAGKYIFAGDLFITRSRMYFFPEVDLEEQRSEITQQLPHELALFAIALLYVSQRVGSYMPRTDFWKPSMTNEQFQKEADEYIEELKSIRRNSAFGETLPLPIRVEAGDISNMNLTFIGRLSFSAQSDTHDFNIGLRRKTQLRNALWEAGLGRV